MSATTKLVFGIGDSDTNKKKIEQLEKDYKEADTAIGESIQELANIVDTVNQALATHKTSDDHDSRYYTETEITNILNAYSKTYIGNSEPSVTSNYIIWINTSNNLLYYRTSATSTSWLPISSVWS